MIAPLAIDGLGYVPLNTPPADPLGGSVVGIVGITPGAIIALVMTPFEIVGLGYVPVNAPPAGPVGVPLSTISGASLARVIDASATLDVVIALSAILLLITEASWIFEVPTALFAILAFVTVLLLSAGFGYVPVKSPPAAPLGGSVVGIVGITPGAIIEPVIAPFPIVGLGYVPVNTPPAGPDGKAFAALSANSA